MAEIIKVSTEEMRECVTQFASAQSELQNAYTWMERSIKMLDSCWKGAAYTAMQTQWNLTYKNIETANERMQDAIDELNQTAELFDSNETSLTGNFQGLDLGDSPFDC